MKYSNRVLPEEDYVRVAENYYALRSEWVAQTKEERHLDMCVCVAKRRKHLMLTGQSACVVLGIARVSPLEIRPHGISEKNRGADIVHWRIGAYDPKATKVKGLLVASAPRAICDLAKFDSTDSLLVSMNYCLHNNLFSKKQLYSEIEKRPGMKAQSSLLKTLKFATEKCESPLETIAWIEIYKAGFVMPQQQKNFYANHEHVARVDMYWETYNRRVILELDGKSKLNNENDLYYEKIREDKLREMGFEVIRAGWRDVQDGRLVKLLKKRMIPMRRYTRREFPR